MRWMGKKDGHDDDPASFSFSKGAYSIIWDDNRCPVRASNDYSRLQFGHWPG